MLRGSLTGSRRRLPAGAGRYTAEALEDRTLLAGWTAFTAYWLDFGYTRQWYDPVPDGTVVTVHAQLGKTGTPPESKDPAIVPSGTITVFWYGGPVLATLDATVVPYDPARPFDSGYALMPEIQVTLSEKNAGIPVASGPWKGYHPLCYSYSGDGNFAAKPQDFTEAEYALANGGADFNNMLKFSDSTDSTAPTQLTYIQTPQKAAKGNTLQPPVRVAIRDDKGRTVTSSAAPVTLALSGGDGTLLGTTTVAADAGIATFSDLSIDKPGTYQITATSGSLQQAVSPPFDITVGKLDFLKTPKSGTAGNPLDPIVVALKDDKGKVITSDNTTTITLSPIGFTGDAPITGNVATVVNGVATFDNLVLKRTGVYQLQASDDNNDAEATSKKFKVAGNKLSASGPKDVDLNRPFPLMVRLLDAKGKLDVNATSSAQLSLNSVDGGSGATLSGTTTAQFIGGVATFSAEAGPMIDQPGRYTLTVTEIEPTTDGFVPSETSSPIETKPFNVGPYHLVFQEQPKGGDVDQPLSFSVAQLNQQKKVNTSLNSHHVQLTLTPLKDTATDAKLSEFTNVGFTAGVQVFSSTQAPSIDSPGLYTLTATEVDANGTPVLTTEPVESKPFKVTGYELKILSQPKLATINRAVPLQLAITNAKGQTVTSFDGAALDLHVSDDAEFEYTQLPVSGGLITLPDHLTSAGFSTGAARVSTPGTHTLTARIVSNGAPIKSIAPATTKPIKFVGQRISVVYTPSIVTAERPVPLKIVMLDAFGKIDTEENTATLKVETEAQLSYSHLPFVNGIIQLPSTSAGALKLLDVGKFQLTIRAAFEDGTPMPDVAPGVTKPIKVLRPKLGFVKEPQGISGGFKLPFFQVAVFDADNKQFEQFNTTLEAFSRSTSSKEEVFLGSATTNDQGIAEFNLLSIDSPGTYVIIVRDVPSSTQATDITSSPIVIGE